METVSCSNLTENNSADFHKALLAQQESVGQKTYPLMVNDEMRTVVKPPQDAPLLKKNRLGKWKLMEFRIGQLAMHLKDGGTWRAGINLTSNKAKDVTAMHFVVIDIDSPGEWVDPYEENCAIVHKTLSNTPDKPYKLRRIYPLSRSVTPDEYEIVFTAVNRAFGSAADGAVKDAIRFFFGSNEPCLKVIDAVPLPVDQILVQERARMESQKRKPGRPVGSVKTEAPATGHASMHIRGINYLWIWSGCYEALLDGHDPSDEQLETFLGYFLRPEYNPRRHGNWYLTEKPPSEAHGRSEWKAWTASNPFSPSDESKSGLKISIELGTDLMPLVAWYDSSGTYKSPWGDDKHGGSMEELVFALDKIFNPSRCPNGLSLPREHKSFIHAVYTNNRIRIPKEVISDYSSDVSVFQSHLLALRNVDISYDSLRKCPCINGTEIKEDDLIVWLGKALQTKFYLSRSERWAAFCDVAKMKTFNLFLDGVEKCSNKYAFDQRLWDNLPLIIGHNWNPQAPQMPTCTKQEFERWTIYLQQFFLSAVVLQNHPGVKVDWMTIMYGPSSSGKSEFTRYITSAEIFGRGMASEYDIHSLDGREQAAQLYECPILSITEMDNTKKGSAAIRKFTSETERAFRALYERGLTRILRQNAILAETNKAVPINDEESYRRFRLLPNIGGIFRDVSGGYNLTHSQKIEISSKLWACANHVYKSKNLTPAQWYKELQLPEKYWEEHRLEVAKHNSGNDFVKLVEDTLAEKLIGVAPDGTQVPWGSENIPEGTRFMFQRTEARRTWFNADDLRDNGGSPRNLLDALTRMGFEEVRAKGPNGVRKHYMMFVQGKSNGTHERPTMDAGVLAQMLNIGQSAPAPQVKPAPVEQYDWADAEKRAQPAPAPQVKPAHPYEVGKGISDVLPVKPAPAPQVKPEQPAQPEMEQPSAEWVDEAAILKQFVPADEPAQPAPSVEPAPQVEPAQPEWVDEEYIPGQHKPVQPTQEESKKAEEELAELSKLLYGD